MRFSQRKGLTPVRTAVQRGSMDQVLRNRLWSAAVVCFFDRIGSGNRYQGDSSAADVFFIRYWHNFSKQPTDSIPYSYENTIANIRKWYMAAKWFEVMDFVEYLVNRPGGSQNNVACLGSPETFVTMCNGLFEEEMSAYRIVNKQIVEITDEQELKAIEDATDRNGPWAAAGTHISKAVGLLFNREKPDYPNAVKEAISAVESACCIVVGSSNSTLGQALKTIEKTHPLHPALKEAFSKMYGYTSDGGGIRHGGIDIASVSCEEAKYLLVACSAFVNYLKGISAKA